MRIRQGRSELEFQHLGYTLRPLRSSRIFDWVAFLPLQSGRHRLCQGCICSRSSRERPRYSGLLAVHPHAWGHEFPKKCTQRDEGDRTIARYIDLASFSQVSSDGENVMLLT